MELGVAVAIHGETDVLAAFQEAREAGFSHGQVTSFVPRITAEEVRQIAVAAREARFHVDAVGCYINPLRPNEAHLNESNMADWNTWVANMAMMNRVERIVCWSGTLGKSLTAPNLLNQEEETFNNLFITLHGMREQVRGLPVEIILEPFAVHVLHDARSCVRMAQKFPGGEVKVVLDPVNLIPPKEWPQRNIRAQALVTALAPAVGLVHLKDMMLAEDGTRHFVAPGKGELDYGPYLRAIAQGLPEVPVIIQQVRGYAEMRAAREFVQSVLKDYSL